MTEQILPKEDLDLLIIPWTNYGQSTMKCPFCGCENVHLRGAFITEDGDGLWDISSHGDCVRRSSALNAAHLHNHGSKGGDVFIKFECEGGCTGVKRHSFHEGLTVVDYVPIPGAYWKEL